MPRILIALIVCSFALPASAERRVLSRGVQEVRAGELLLVEFEAAHGLTPPPGIQNERALKGYSARLCLASACVPLAAINVRPRDGWSLRYRAEFVVPVDLAAGRYDLDVRFPGHFGSVPAGVVVTSAILSTPAPISANGCAGAPPSVGLLLAVLSAKLAAIRRHRRVRHGNRIR